MTRVGFKASSGVEQLLWVDYGVSRSDSPCLEPAARVGPPNSRGSRRPGSGQKRTAATDRFGQLGQNGSVRAISSAAHGRATRRSTLLDRAL